MGNVTQIYSIVNDAIAQAEAQLDQTNVDIEAFEAAKDNFYSVRDQILNRDKEPEEKETLSFKYFFTSSFDLEFIIDLAIRFFSFIFYFSFSL